MSWEAFCEWAYSTWKAFCDFWITNQEGSLNNLTRILLAIIVAVLGYLLIKWFFGHLKKVRLKRLSKLNKTEKTFATFILDVVSLLFYVLLAYAVLRILNFDTTTLAGIISAGTVAIGLSLQEIIKAFASGVILLNTKNIMIGEYIGIQTSYGNFEGTVVSVGLLQTTLKTPLGQIVTVNNNLVQSGVATNYTRNKIRRMDIIVSVDYGTDVKLCKQVLLNILENYGTFLPDQGLSVMLTDFGEYSLDFTMRGWTTNDTYWDTRNNIREKIFDELNKNDIKIPFRRIVIEDVSGKTDISVPTK